MAEMIGGNPYFRTAQVNIGTTPTLVVAADNQRLMLHLINSGDGAIYIGDVSVTTATGYPVLGPSAITVSTRDEIYGVVASGTATIGYFEEHW